MEEFVEIVEEATAETAESDSEVPAEESAEAELKAEDNAPVESSEEVGEPAGSANPASE